jgi:hypothetical protein
MAYPIALLTAFGSPYQTDHLVAAISLTFWRFGFGFVPSICG